MEKHHLSWKDVEDLTKKLAAAIRESGYAPDCLIGIAKGGLAPLALLAREFPECAVATITAKSYKGETRGELSVSSYPDADLSGKKVLLIDEIADSGTTLRTIADTIQARSAPSSLMTATFAVNADRCKKRPDFHILADSSWLVFPWE